MSSTGTTGDVAVSVRDVSKRFGGVTALDATTLDIAKGEFFSLLGPSGCGKTTLLRIIGGFEQPNGGDVLIGGRSVLGDPPYRRRTNMIFQHLALFPHLTVAQNIAFGLEMKKRPRPEIERRIDEVLALVRLPGYGDRRIDALSGGQRQRVAMARALVNDPEVLLLDEPLGALDLQLRLQLQEELRRLHRETGSTFVFVTHDQGEAIVMSDRIAVMDAGRILQVGTPREVYERPRRRFVAEFMGHSNFLEGRVEAVGADGFGVVQVGPDRLRGRVVEGVRPGDAVVVALRYEKVEVAPETTALGLAAVIDEIIYMGSAIRYVLRVRDGLTLVADAANTGAAAGFAVGDRVRARWSDDSPTALKD